MHDDDEYDDELLDAIDNICAQHEQARQQQQRVPQAAPAYAKPAPVSIKPHMPGAQHAQHQPSAVIAHANASNNSSGNNTIRIAPASFFPENHIHKPAAPGNRPVHNKTWIHGQYGNNQQQQQQQQAQYGAQAGVSPASKNAQHLSKPSYEHGVVQQPGVYGPGQQQQQRQPIHAPPTANLSNAPMQRLGQANSHPTCTSNTSSNTHVTPPDSVAHGGAHEPGRANVVDINLAAHAPGSATASHGHAIASALKPSGIPHKPINGNVNDSSATNATAGHPVPDSRPNQTHDKGVSFSTVHTVVQNVAQLQGPAYGPNSAHNRGMQHPHANSCPRPQDKPSHVVLMKYQQHDSQPGAVGPAMATPSGCSKHLEAVGPMPCAQPTAPACLHHQESNLLPNMQRHTVRDQQGHPEQHRRPSHAGWSASTLPAGSANNVPHSHHDHHDHQRPQQDQQQSSVNTLQALPQVMLPTRPLHSSHYQQHQRMPQDVQHTHNAGQLQQTSIYQAAGSTGNTGRDQQTTTSSFSTVTNAGPGSNVHRTDQNQHFNQHHQHPVNPAGERPVNSVVQAGCIPQRSVPTVSTGILQHAASAAQQQPQQQPKGHAAASLLSPSPGSAPVSLHTYQPQPSTSGIPTAPPRHPSPAPPPPADQGSARTAQPPAIAAHTVQSVGHQAQILRSANSEQKQSGHEAKPTALPPPAAAAAQVVPAVAPPHTAAQPAVKPKPVLQKLKPSSSALAAQLAASAAAPPPPNRSFATASAATGVASLQHPSASNSRVPFSDNSASKIPPGPAPVSNAAQEKTTATTGSGNVSGGSALPRAPFVTRPLGGTVTDAPPPRAERQIGDAGKRPHSADDPSMCENEGPDRESGHVSKRQKTSAPVGHFGDGNGRSYQRHSGHHEDPPSNSHTHAGTNHNHHQQQRPQHSGHGAPVSGPACTVQGAPAASLHHPGTDTHSNGHHGNSNHSNGNTHQVSGDSGQHGTSSGQANPYHSHSSGTHREESHHSGQATGAGMMQGQHHIHKVQANREAAQAALLSTSKTPGRSKKHAAAAAPALPPPKWFVSVNVNLDSSTHYAIRFIDRPPPDLEPALRSQPGHAFDAARVLHLIPCRGFQDVCTSIEKDHGVRLKPNWQVPNIVQSLFAASGALCDDSSRYEQLHQVYDEYGESLHHRMMQFQREGVQFALRHGGRVLIGDQMGLGKTVQGCALLRCYQDEWPALIVTPSSLRQQWADALKKWINAIDIDIHIVFGGRDASKVESLARDRQAGKKSPPAFQILIISYDYVQRLHQALTDIKFGIVLLDEAHYIKNYQAKRTKASLPLLQHARRAVLLTGTPALSRPIELLPLMQAALPQAKPDFNDFCNRYCVPDKFSRTRGARNVDELNRVLCGTFMIRRLKAEVLKQLPPKTRQQVYLSVDDKVEKGLKKQQEQLAHIKQILQTMHPDSNGSMLFGLQSEQQQAIMRLYHQTASLKVPAVQEYIKDMIENDIKFLVFAHHHELLDGIEKAVNDTKTKYIRIDGKTNPKNRDALRAQFQEDEATKVAVLGITAAGVGLTLTAASTVVFAELSWVPGEIMQAEDRVHRIGQENNVHIQFLLVRRSIDDIMWETVQSKLSSIGKVLDGKQDSLHVQSRYDLAPTTAGMGTLDGYMEGAGVDQGGRSGNGGAGSGHTSGPAARALGAHMQAQAMKSATAKPADAAVGGSEAANKEQNGSKKDSGKQKRMDSFVKSAGSTPSGTTTNVGDAGRGEYGLRHAAQSDSDDDGCILILDDDQGPGGGKSRPNTETFAGQNDPNLKRLRDWDDDD